MLVDLVHLDCNYDTFKDMFRPLSSGQRGVVCEMNGNVALVLLESDEKETGGASSDKLSANHALHWIQGIFVGINHKMIWFTSRLYPAITHSFLVVAI